MRALVLGASGMLGRELVARVPADVTLVDASRTGAGGRIDITDRGAVATALDSLEPDVVVNAAAYTAVDGAEQEAAVAHAVNGTAVGMLATECSARGVRLVHFSTDYVFAGDAARPYRESDAVAPIGAYGESKLAGERLIAASGAEHLIVRTQWLFGVHGKSFPRTMWMRAQAGLPTRVVNDQFGRPTYAVDLAAWTWALTLAGVTGVVHAANGGDPVTWYDVARVVFERAGHSSLLSPCATAEYPTPARRPAYSALDVSRLEGIVGPVPDWKDGLSRFLSELV